MTSCQEDSFDLEGLLKGSQGPSGVHNLCFNNHCSRSLGLKKRHFFFFFNFLNKINSGSRKPGVLNSLGFVLPLLGWATAPRTENRRGPWSLLVDADAAPCPGSSGLCRAGGSDGTCTVPESCEQRDPPRSPALASGVLSS